MVIQWKDNYSDSSEGPFWGKKPKKPNSAIYELCDPGSSLFSF